MYSVPTRFVHCVNISQFHSLSGTCTRKRLRHITFHPDFVLRNISSFERMKGKLLGKMKLKLFPLFVMKTSVPV